MDSTEQQRMEQALRDSEERFRQLAEHIREVFWLWDIAGKRLLYISPAYETIWGRSCQYLLEVQPRDWLEGVYPEDRARVLTAHMQKDTAGVFNETYRILRPDGTLRWIRDRGFPIHDTAGRSYRFAGIAEDITEIKQAELVLLGNQRRLQALFDNALDAILLANDNGRFVDANPAACALLARPRAEVLQMTVFEITPSPDQQRAHSLWKSFTEAEGKQSGEYSLLRKDGTTAVVEYRAVANILPGLHLSILRDITRRKQAEKQLQQQQVEMAHMARLGMAGELAAGLAHELNQPLSAIATYAETGLYWLHSKESNPGQFIELLEKIMDQGLRAGEIIRRLRNFLRKTETKKEAIDLNGLIGETIQLITPELQQAAIKVRLQLTDPLPPVLADAIQIQQVLLNLVHNSREALQETPVDQREMVIRTGLAGSGAVEIAIADTGPGLSEEAMTRLFQPFFTTKATGMGLGLSLSRSIIESHGGRLWVQPNPERGVTFQCTLPIRTRD